MPVYKLNEQISWELDKKKKIMKKHKFAGIRTNLILDCDFGRIHVKSWKAVMLEHYSAFI